MKHRLPGDEALVNHAERAVWRQADVDTHGIILHHHDVYKAWFSNKGTARDQTKPSLWLRESLGHMRRVLALASEQGWQQWFMKALEIYEKLSREKLKECFTELFARQNVIVILQEMWEKCRGKVAYE